VTREEFIAKVQAIIDGFVLPGPRFPYNEIDGSRLIKTPSGAVREDGEGRLYVKPPKSWLIVGRDDERCERKMVRESLRTLNDMLFSQLEFPQVALDAIKGLKFAATSREACQIYYDSHDRAYRLNRKRLFIVSCTTRCDLLVRRFKEIH